MKKKAIGRFTNSRIPRKNYLGITSVLTALILTSCGTTPAIIDTVKDTPNETDIPLTTTTPNDKVNVAFAGGGWRAHTGHSAWTIALLDHGNKKLDAAFSNVETVSSNSGGSWFSSMLMYSPDFVTQIEAKNAVNTWATTGWTGQQRAHFDNAPCSLAPEGIYLECVFDHYTGKDITGGTYWKLVVDNLIFKDYPLRNQKLNDPHQYWATNKGLLMASSLLTNSVILNKENDLEGNHRYYQACLSPSTPILNGSSGSTCSAGISTDVTPVTFSSMTRGSTSSSSPFLAELNPNSNSFYLGYTADYEVESAPKFSKIITNPLVNSNVLVTNAAAASSAALGFGASEHVTGSFDFSYGFEEDALSFSLVDSKVQYVDANGLDLKSLSDQKIVRLADGGAVDNSAVAQLVRSLQLNNKADGFNIVSFDNVTTITAPNETTAKVGIDIASLFGYKDPLCVDLKFTEYCVTSPELQIFDSHPLYRTIATWKYELPGGKYLIYSQYEVITIENPQLGIKAGSTGTLHSFTCSYPSASTSPYDGDTDFDAYDAMFEFINSGLSEHGGLQFLESALGLK